MLLWLFVCCKKRGNHLFFQITFLQMYIYRNIYKLYYLHINREENGEDMSTSLIINHQPLVVASVLSYAEYFLPFPAKNRLRPHGGYGKKNNCQVRCLKIRKARSMM